MGFIGNMVLNMGTIVCIIFIFIVKCSIRSGQVKSVFFFQIEKVNLDIS